MSFATKVDDGYGGFMYNPTTAGYVLLGVILLALLIGIFLMNRNRTRIQVSAKQLVFSALAIALAIVTSNIKVFKMPMGGSITLFSMFFICLIGYWYGAKIGLMTGIAYGLVQLVIDPYIISIPQMLIDYPLSFGALGLSGLFTNKNKGLIRGYILGVTGRYIFSILSGVIFFGAFAPATMSPLLYSILYNLSYMGPEAGATVALLVLPQISKALVHTKKLATT